MAGFLAPLRLYVVPQPLNVHHCCPEISPFNTINVHHREKEIVWLVVWKSKYLNIGPLARTAPVNPRFAFAIPLDCDPYPYRHLIPRTISFSYQPRHPDKKDPFLANKEGTPDWQRPVFSI